jgi:hypothetical protein
LVACWDGEGGGLDSEEKDIKETSKTGKRGKSRIKDVDFTISKVVV